MITAIKKFWATIMAQAKPISCRGFATFMTLTVIAFPVCFLIIGYYLWEEAGLLAREDLVTPAEHLHLVQTIIASGTSAMLTFLVVGVFLAAYAFVMLLDCFIGPWAEYFWKRRKAT